MTTAQIRRAKSIKCFKIQVMHVQEKTYSGWIKNDANEMKFAVVHHILQFIRKCIFEHTQTLQKKYIVHSEFAI